MRSIVPFVMNGIDFQTFATPNHHPRSQPFFDHVFSFSVTPDLKIWFRNFQIVDETLQLQEIGESSKRPCFSGLFVLWLAIIMGTYAS